MSAAYDPYSPTMSPYIAYNADTPRPFVVKPAPVKLDNLECLEGQNNYEDWASQMSMALIFKPTTSYSLT